MGGVPFTSAANQLSRISADKSNYGNHQTFNTCLPCVYDTIHHRDVRWYFFLLAYRSYAYRNIFGDLLRV